MYNYIGFGAHITHISKLCNIGPNWRYQYANVCKLASLHTFAYWYTSDCTQYYTYGYSWLGAPETLYFPKSNWKVLEIHVKICVLFV